MRLAWEAATDDTSMAEALKYEIHYATTAGATFVVRSEALGTITHDVTLLQSGTTYYFRVRCRDEAGNVDTNSVEVSATTTGVPDVTVPTITLESPLENGSLSPATPVVVRVTDAIGIRRASMHCTYPSRPDLPEECIHNGDDFNTLLFGGSSRETLIADRDYRYTVIRTGDWPDAPLITVRAIDTSGNEVA